MMDLLLYIYLFNLLFVALSLLQQDVRLYWMNIVQYLLLCGLLGWMIYSQRTGEGYLWIATALFLLVVFVSRQVLQVASRLGYVGRFELASWFALLGLILSWNSLNLFQYRFYRSLTRMRSGSFEEVYRSILKILERVRSRSVRCVALSNVLMLLVLGRRWEEATEVHGRFGGGVELPATVWMHLVRAYSEQGMFDEALACQFCLEECEEAGEGPLLAGRIHLLALAGDVGRVCSLFDEATRSEWPACYRSYWVGRALLAAGRVEEGMESLEDAGRLAADEPNWSQVISGLLEQARKGLLPPPVQLDAAFRGEMDRLDLREGRAWHRRRRGERPLVRDLRWVRTGWVTMGLLVANVVAFLGMTLAGGSEDFHVLLRFGALAPQLVEVGEWWRMVSCLFLHVGFLHVILNMFGLYMMGNFLENQYGSRRFLFIYLFSGLFASWVSYATGDYSVSVGASGAICGLLGGALAFGLKYRRALHARLRNGLIYNLSLMIGFLVLLGVFFERIDNAAHLGGTLGGFVLTFLLVAPRIQPVAPIWERRILVVGLGLVLLPTLLGLVECTVELSRGGYPSRTVHKTVRLEEGGERISIPAVYLLVDPYRRDQPDLHRLVASMIQAAGGTIRWTGFREPWPYQFVWGAAGRVAPHLDPESERTLRDQRVDAIQSVIRQMAELKSGPTVPEEVFLQKLGAFEISFSYALEAELDTELDTSQVVQWERRVVLYFRELEGQTYLFWFDLPEHATQLYLSVMQGIVASLRWAR